MGKITSRPYEHGDPKECTDWPPKRPKEDAKGTYYWDSEKREFVRGSPPPRVNQFGRSAAIHGDSIPAFYHHGACRMVDSRQEAERLDAMTGTRTSDVKIGPDKAAIAEKKKAFDKERKEVLVKAAADLDNGNVKLTDEVKAKCVERNEALSQAYGMDFFNVTGRKTDERGRKYRKRK